MAEIRDQDGLLNLLEQLEDLRVDRSLPISIVESDIVSKKKINDLLSADGYRQVKVFKSGMQLLGDLGSTNDERIAVYDLSDPAMNGVDFLQAIRKSGREGWVWILFTVKQRLPENVFQAITNSGICEVLIKPVYEAKLRKSLGRLSQWIQARRLKSKS